MRLTAFLYSTFLIAATAAVDFECFFSSEDYPSYGFAYSCAIKNGIISRKSDVEVKSMNGSHIKDDKSNKDVIGFLIFYKESKHFPLRVTEYFENIAVISVEYSRLAEIHKEDLRQFGEKLVDLGLEGNEIESIEKDLFMYNPNIEYVSLISNKIRTISENVFDNLKVLNGINLIDNNCINYVYYGREIRDFVRSIKLKCNENFSSTDVRVPTIVTEVEFNSFLVKFYKQKVEALELKIKEMERKIICTS